MTAKDKAAELCHKYYTTLLPNVRKRQRIAVEHSLIAVDEIINASPSLPILSESGNLYSDIQESKLYWEEVKNELLKQQNQ